MLSAESKMNSPDRVLTLSVKEGKKAMNSMGLVDPRLFTGENKLHCVMDPTTCLWAFKYEMGGIPEALKGNFTSFTAARKFAEGYYFPRNIEITQVKD